MSRYVTREVLDQIYKLYVRPHLNYGDIIYHKYDPHMVLDFTKKLEATQTLLRLQLVVLGVEQIVINCMRNLPEADTFL